MTQKRIFGIAALVTVLTFFYAPLAAAEGQLEFAFSGGFAHHFSFGSASDYSPGINDFPVMPAHTPPALGLSVLYLFTSHLGLEYQARFFSSSDIVLADPADGDSFSLETARHLSLGISVLWQISSGRFSPLVFLGGGLDRMIVEDRSYTTSLGYKIVMERPLEDALLDPFIQAGVGLQAALLGPVGLRLDIRYTRIFSVTGQQDVLNASLGLVVRIK